MRGANRRASSSPPKAVVQPLARGPGPMSHPPWAPVPGCREVEPPLTPVLCLLGAAAEDREGEFSKPNAAVSRHPAHGPVKPSSAESAGQSVAGTGVAVNVTDDRLTARAHRVNIARARRVDVAQKWRPSHRSCQADARYKFWPHLQARSSPEVGPGATVGTLNQGYPYYSMKMRCPRDYL
jgi:hypothetical protein